MAELVFMKTVAAIDCGTNSIRLLIVKGERPSIGADSPATGSSPITPDFHWQELVREMRIVRLGQDIDRTKKFAPEALERTYRACQEYAELIKRHGVEEIRFIGTSASRDATNREEYLAKVKEILGVEVEVVPGEIEAQLSFTGAISALKSTSLNPTPNSSISPVKKDISSTNDCSSLLSDTTQAGDREKILLVDIGGGSTEFVLGQGEKILHSHSVDMGSVRLYERYLRDLITQYQGDGSLCPERAPFMQSGVKKAQAKVGEILKNLHQEFDFTQVDKLVGVAGTVTTITATALGLTSYQPEKIGGAVLSHEDTLAACDKLMGMNVSERNQLGFMPTGRADVIGAGAIIWKEIIQQISHYPTPPLSTATTSENDILDGIALSMF